MGQINLLSKRLKRALMPLTVFSRAQVNFQSDAVYIEATKESRTAKVCVTVPSPLFQISNMSDLKIGICPQNLLPIVQLLDNDIHVDIHVGSGNKIIISSNGFTYRTYKLDTKYIYNMNMSDEEWSEYSVSARMSGAELSRGLKLANKIATHCKLEFCPNDSSVVLSASGDSDSVKEHTSVDDMRINIDRIQEDHLKMINYYPLDYFYEIYNLIPDTATVDFSLRQSQLMMSYPIENNVGNICFILAESVNPGSF